MLLAEGVEAAQGTLGNRPGDGYEYSADSGRLEGAARSSSCASAPGTDSSAHAFCSAEEGTGCGSADILKSAVTAQGEKCWLISNVILVGMSESISISRLGKPLSANSIARCAGTFFASSLRIQFSTASNLLPT